MRRSEPREETLEGSSGQQAQPSLVFESCQSRLQTHEGRCTQMSLGLRGSNLLAEAPDITEDRQAVFTVSEVWAHRIKEHNKMVVQYQEVLERFVTQ